MNVELDWTVASGLLNMCSTEKKVLLCFKSLDSVQCCKKFISLVNLFL